MECKSSYSHYYKKVPEGVEYIDVYRVLEMFSVSDPAIQHALKKLLVAGGRGHKNLIKDVEEAIISLNRWVEMRNEENVDKNPPSMQYDMFSSDTITTIGVDFTDSIPITKSCMID